MRKVLVGFIGSVLLVMLVAIPAYAAPEIMPDGTKFDAEYYAETYPDVVEALGTDPAVLYQHYLMFGKAEGRNAVKPPEPEYHSALDYSSHYKEIIYIDGVPDGVSKFDYYMSITCPSGDDLRALEDSILEKTGISRDMSDAEKVRRAHDYLCDNHVYGEETKSIRGYIINRYVCHNYSKDFYDILAAAGMQVEYISGGSKNGEHAWNRVWMNDDYYYIDVTWDDCWRDDGDYSDPWYMISFDRMEKDHTMQYVGTP